MIYVVYKKKVRTGYRSGKQRCAKRYFGLPIVGNLAHIEVDPSVTEYWFTEAPNRKEAISRVREHVKSMALPKGKD